MSYDRRATDPVRELLESGLGRVPGDLLGAIDQVAEAQTAVRVKLKNVRGEVEERVRKGLAALDVLTPTLTNDQKVQLLPVRFALEHSLDAVQAMESTSNSTFNQLRHSLTGMGEAAKEAIKVVQRAYRVATRVATGDKQALIAAKAELERRIKHLEAVLDDLDEPFKVNVRDFDRGFHGNLKMFAKAVQDESQKGATKIRGAIQGMREILDYVEHHLNS